jgi:methyl-accepting chemotaxis protein
MKINVKIFAISLLSYITAAMIYVVFLYLSYGQTGRIEGAIFTVSALLIIIFLPLSFVMAYIVKPIKKAEVEYLLNGNISKETEHYVNIAHRKISIYGFLFQNIAVIIAYIIGHFIIYGDYLGIVFWGNFSQVFSSFLLASAFQVILFNIVIGRTREKIGIEYISKKDKIIGIAYKIGITVISMVAFVSVYSATIPNGGFAKLKVDLGLFYTYPEKFNAKEPQEMLELTEKTIQRMEKTYKEFGDYLNEINNEVENYTKEGISKEEAEILYDIRIRENPIFQKIDEYQNVTHSYSLTFILLMGGITILITLLLLYDLRIQIISIKSKMENLIQDERDLTTRLKVTTIDEFGEIVSNINRLFDNQQDDIKSIITLSEEVSRSEKELRHTIDNVSDSSTEIKEETEKVHNLYVEQTKLIETTSNNINDIVSSIKNINDEMSTQTAITEQTSSSVNQMVTSISRVEEMTSKASDIASNLLKITDKGNSYIKDNNNAMTDIKQASERVSEMVTSIKDIAKKTNLLAMNASIEAAHAGGSGKGFAVVADEIRKLAENSSESSQQIIAEIEQMLQAVNNGVELSNKTGKAFNQILTGIKNSNQLIQQIANAMKEQDLGTADIIKAISNMVESAKGVKEMIELQNEKSEDIINSNQQVVDSSKEIDKATEKQVESMEKILNSINVLKDIVQTNRKTVKMLNELTQAYMINDNKIENAEEETRLITEINVDEKYKK